MKSRAAVAARTVETVEPRDVEGPDPGRFAPNAELTGVYGPDAHTLCGRQAGSTHRGAIKGHRRLCDLPPSLHAPPPPFPRPFSPN
ncbi:hypothetical protein [Streptomyces tsukubensis]|uniref:Uncharacterized protein n=1 Tax=Streptomyces tsukubensis TaxID=83656 RepID=A0A1V4AA61_9ACTN|nr:hypothetical protein [Streptomyces tsukubensis]OON80520.1 hypothetical protein B1H18_11435 [Streptomyces tsukubensis]QFR96169.1 hypothetical protein GBW32_27910 [Streptomyces tsukubensis]